MFRGFVVEDLVIDSFILLLKNSAQGRSEATAVLSNSISQNGSNSFLSQRIPTCSVKMETLLFLGL